MVLHHFRVALLTALVAVGATASARAGDCCAPAQNCCCQSYRYEWRTECYTAYRCETYPETRTCCYTVYRRVPECKTITRCYCVNVPVCEERTVMQQCWVCKPCTRTVRCCVDKGH